MIKPSIRAHLENHLSCTSAPGMRVTTAGGGRLVRPGIAAVLGLAISGWSPSRAGAQSCYTTWTSIDGDTVQARLLGWDEAHLFLSKGGHDHRVPFEILTPESVAKARRLLDPHAEKSTTSAGTIQTKLPGNPLQDQTARAYHGNLGMTAPAPVSRATLMAAANRVRDRHTMPVYEFNVRQRVVRTTAYTCSESDHLIYGSRNAVGTQLQCSDQIRSAAADWSFYPVGTTFRIKGLPHLFVIDDYGSALTGAGTIDIYQPDLMSMRQWGRRTVEVTIIQWGSFARSAEILSKRTGSKHCRKMLANLIRIRQRLTP